MAWLMAIGVAIATLALLLAVRRTVLRYHRKFDEVNRASILRIPLQVASRTAALFFLVVALFVGAQVLTLVGDGGLEDDFAIPAQQLFVASMPSQDRA